MTFIDDHVPREFEPVAASAPRSAPLVRWTEDAELDAEQAGAVPNAPGVIVLLRGTPAEEVLVWATATDSLRVRALELLCVPQHGELKHILEDAELRFRCAVIVDPQQRTAVAHALSEASGHAPSTRGATLIFYANPDAPAVTVRRER